MSMSISIKQIYWWDPQKSGPSKNCFFSCHDHTWRCHQEFQVRIPASEVPEKNLGDAGELQYSNVFFPRKNTQKTNNEKQYKIRRYSVFAVFPPFFARQKMRNNQKNRKKTNNNLGSSLVCSRKKAKITRKKKTCNTFWEVLFLVCFVSCIFVFVFVRPVYSFFSVLHFPMTVFLFTS